MSIPVEQVGPYARRLGDKPLKRTKGSQPVKTKSPSTEHEGAPLTLSVPEAGKKYFGMGRNASYEAARRGQLPAIRIGKFIRVPVRALERMLDNATSKIEAAE